MKTLEKLLYCIFLIGICIFFFANNITISLWFNDHHMPFFDTITPYLTVCGDGITFILFSIIVFFYKRERFLPFPLSFIGFSIVIQILKRIIFSDHFRPIVVLQHIFNDITINTIPGVEIIEKYSFPSGHSATVFSLVILIVYLFKIKNILYIVLLILGAISISISRLYLLHHFYIDVYCGALIGTIITFLSIYVCEEYDLNNKQPFKFLLNIFRIN